MRVIGTGVSVPVATALTVCTMSTFLFMWYKFGGHGSGKRTGEIPPGSAPVDGVFTFATLAKFDGKKLPMCLGICGKVVNVSSSDNFTPEQGYGKLWAGRETTYAMAKVSLTDSDANRLDFKLEDLTVAERTTLAGWYKHFTTKYPVVGTLKELEDWDFTSVYEEAKSQTPFGIGKLKGGDTQEGGLVDDSPVADVKAAGMKPPWILRPGAKVLIQGNTDQPELNGKVGTVVDFVADEKSFAVNFGRGYPEKTLVKPACMKEPEATD